MVWKKLFKSSRLKLPIDGLLRNCSGRLFQESLDDGTNELANRVVRLGNVTKYLTIARLYHLVPYDSLFYTLE